MTTLKPNSPIKLRKVIGGSQQYLTEDSLYIVFKESKGWGWQVSDGSQWVTKDKRRYKTRNWCLKCVEADMQQTNNELELWEA